MTKEVMKSLSETLGMNPLIVEDKTEIIDSECTEIATVSEPVELTQEEKDAEEDFKLARDNVRSLAEKGQESLESIMRIAEASEHPRAFEVVATLMKTLVEANKSLLELHEARRQLAPISKEEKKAETSVTNNLAFIGTTTELLQLIKEGKHPQGNIIDGISRAS